MDQPTSTPARGISITVDGTANFYFAGAAAPVGQQPILPAPPQAVAVLEKKLRFDPDYAHRPGYKTNFLGVQVPLPGVSQARQGELLKHNGAVLLLKYHHYSLVMNEHRRLQKIRRERRLHNLKAAEVACRLRYGYMDSRPTHSGGTTDPRPGTVRPREKVRSRTHRQPGGHRLGRYC